jgi:hypothetical protein
MSQIYEIRIKSHLSPSWSEWLGDLTISHEDNGESLLQGHITDQAALHGILNRIRDLGLTLISVQQLDEGAGQHQIGSDDQIP